MKTIPELIEEKEANFKTLLASREQLAQQLNEVNTALLQLQGHIEGLNAAKNASAPDDK